MPVHIEVKLFATLKKFTPASAARYPVTAGTTVGDLFDRREFPRGLVKVMLVNATNKTVDYRIQGGERIGIFPPVGGG